MVGALVDQNIENKLHAFTSDGSFSHHSNSSTRAKLQMMCSIVLHYVYYTALHCTIMTICYTTIPYDTLSCIYTIIIFHQAVHKFDFSCKCARNLHAL